MRTGRYIPCVSPKSQSTAHTDTTSYTAVDQWVKSDTNGHGVSSMLPLFSVLYILLLIAKDWKKRETKKALSIVQQMAVHKEAKLNFHGTHHNHVLLQTTMHSAQVAQKTCNRDKQQWKCRYCDVRRLQNALFNQTMPKTGDVAMAV